MSYGQSDPFRAYYADRLRQLTFNSRPIIQDLSVIALEKRNEGNFPAMRGIVEEIENALLRVCLDADLCSPTPVTFSQCFLTRDTLVGSVAGEITPPLPPRFDLEECRSAIY